MLYYDRIDSSNVNKTSDSKEFNICHYWYFLDKVFRFQLDICNECHDLLMISMNLVDNAILNIIATDYVCIVMSYI